MIILQVYLFGKSKCHSFVTSVICKIRLGHKIESAGLLNLSDIKNEVSPGQCSVARYS